MDVDYLIQAFETLSKQPRKVVGRVGQGIDFERTGFQALDWKDNLSGFPSQTKRILQFLKEKNVKLVGQGKPLNIVKKWKKIDSISQEIPLAALNYLFDKNAQDLLSKEDITFGEFLDMLDKIKGKNF